MAPRHLRQHLAHPQPHLDPPSRDSQLPDHPPELQPQEQKLPQPQPQQQQQQEQQPCSLLHDSHLDDLNPTEKQSPSQLLHHQSTPPPQEELHDQPSRLKDHAQAQRLQQLRPQGTPPENAESSADSGREPDASELAEQPRSASGAATVIAAEVPPYSNGRGSISSLPCGQVEELLRPCLTAAESRAAKLLQQTMDTVQSQILRALHQAALDIIEHLGKEAATRVVVAERKAAVLQQELFNVKQQAFSMLLRLKEDTDAQILEAENKYLVERKRAQEAEAKLVAVQDTSKRLKSELRKKGEILEKMQKLVQPDGEYLEKSSRLAETVERRRISSRSKVNDLHSKSHPPDFENKILCNSENVKESRHIKNGFPPVLSSGINMQKTPPTVHHPHKAAPEQTAEMKLDRRWENSTAEMSSSAKIGLVGVKSLSGLHDSSSACLDPEVGRGLLAESHAAEGSLIRNSQGDKTDDLVLLRQSGPVKLSSVSSVQNYDRQVDEVDNAELHKSTPCLEDIQKPVAAGLQISTELHGDHTNDVGNSMVVEERSSSFHKSLLGKVEGILLKEEVQCVLDECLSKSVCRESFGKHIFEAKADVCDTSIRRTQVEDKSDTLERGCQTLDSQKNAREYVLGPKTRSNTGDLVVAMEPSCSPEPCKKDDRDLCVDPHEQDPESTACMSENHGPVMSSEFVRPDYDVATSLTELAVTAKEVENNPAEALASDVRKREIDNAPRKLGLRMKRKASFLEQKDCSGLPTTQRKKPRVGKGQAGLSDSHTERISRRPRLGNLPSSKDSLAVESSRDSRRLMQGARQLLCLSEKKWR